MKQPYSRKDDKPKAVNFTMVSNKIIQSEELTADEKIMYIILKSFNPSYPSNKRLIELTGWGKNKVINIKQRLVELKFITSKRRRNNSNLYEVKKFEEIQTVSPVNSQEFGCNDTNNTNIRLTPGDKYINSAESLVCKLYNSDADFDSLTDKPSTIDYEADNIYDIDDYTAPIDTQIVNKIFANSHTISNANVIHR
ncbi:helix-turn-helix domain-containing protein [Flavobacterium filum]|uniref:helix-turn-helix domain-containing protein n=1 Tax=Flavobacterium filum TaxID=370974 RepID=UPI0023F3DDDD|nr:helix-turn-helix domain-containing protein [Flavobacterium filum]